QTIGARFAHGHISLEYAQEMGCRACASPGGGCQFLGTAATSQVIGEALGLTTRDILTDAALHNAMIAHAAFGGSTNLLLHLPAIAFHAGLTRPTARDWERLNKQVPRLVDCLPN